MLSVKGVSAVGRWMQKGALGKTRLVAVVFGCVTLGAQVPRLGGPGPFVTRDALALAALGLLAAIMVVTYVRKRVTWLEPVVIPALIIAAGTDLVDPVATTTLCIGTMIPQALYGSGALWAVRSITIIAALPAAVELSTHAPERALSWNDPTVLAILPQLVLFSVLMRALYLALLQQEQTDEREALLARTGAKLLACTDVPQVRRVGDEAAAQLAALTPGTGVMVLERQKSGLRVIGAAGLPDTLLGTTLPESSVDGLDPLESATPRPVAEAARAEIKAHAPAVRHWHGAGLANVEADRFLLVGGTRRVSGVVFDAFRNLGHQLALAEVNCLSHAQLYHQAHYDQLTALATRALLFERLAGAVDANIDATLMIIDLDDFKQVNDAFGHSAGDELLVAVANRIKEVGGPGAVPARFGGDEFALLLMGVADPARVDRIANRLCQRLLEPIQLNATTVAAGASIGLTESTPGLTAGELMRRADIAMYSAKARGKNRVERFTMERHGDIAQHRLLEEHLNHAIERNEIVLYYQPYVDLRTGACVGVEALVRWHHPDLGMPAPSQFIPIAELTGQINALGEHVLRGACRQMSAWDALSDGPSLRISVNVAPRQLLDTRFALIVGSALRDAGLPADRLTLELVESEHMDDETAHAQLDELAAMGVRMAIADFGTGYASLASLRSFPVHQIRIDPGFLASDEMLHMVISIGEILELETLATGIHTPQEAIRLRQANVPLGQGDLFGDAMPAEDFPRWLRDHARSASEQLLQFTAQEVEHEQGGHAP